MKLITFIVLACAVCMLHASFVEDWTRVEEARDSESIVFFVALKQRNIDQLETLLYAVSDPESPSYGQHATKEQIRDLTSAPKADVNHVRSFFLSRNIPAENIEVFDDAMKITTDVSSVKNIFGASFHWYVHGPSQHKVIRSGAEGIQIPHEIQAKIDFVTELVSFPIIMKKQKTEILKELADVEAGTYGFFAPATLRTLYNIPADLATVSSKSSQAAIEFYPEGAFSFDDLAQFCKLSDEKFYNYTHIVGPFNAGGWGNTESELDVQLLGTIGSGADNWFWTIQNGWIWEMALNIYAAHTKPYVYSISYGWPEVLTCNSGVVLANCSNGDNADYIGRANAELMKLGSMGYTIVTCSQDEGAPSSANMYCSNTTHPVFGIYPGSSPYVTTVSGTAAGPEASDNVVSAADPPICQQIPPCDTSKTEAPCMPTNTYYQWTTGGGFSEITARPSYQASVVSAYVASKVEKPPAKFYWPNNRGYPDISAIGARVLIVSGGAVSVAEGTSASTPIVAGIVTLLNDWRFSQGKSALGFLNPVLYKMPANCFQDITTGDNKCTEGGQCCTYGYGCGVGWDAVTGLGSPNYGNMLTFVKTLP